jgi:hypothetical protein
MAKTLVSVSQDMRSTVNRPSILVEVPDELQLGEQAVVEYHNQHLVVEVKQAQSWHPQYEGDTGQYVEVIGIR